MALRMKERATHRRQKRFMTFVASYFLWTEEHKDVKEYFEKSPFYVNHKLEK
jgi:hypothetical protein